MTHSIMLHGYQSFSSETESYAIYFKGSIHISKVKADTETWIRMLKEHLVINESDVKGFLLSELEKIAGLFSLVILKGNNCFLAGDIIRSLPVFYGFRNGELFITDNLNEYQEQNGSLPIDDDKLEEYISAGFVFGAGTIYKNVFAIQAGELVTINKPEILSERYFEFKPSKDLLNYENTGTFSELLDKVLLSVFSRLLEQTPDVNRWIVPLSGGHDSRTIVNYLYRLGIRNVVCFSYGMPDNEQSQLSRQVAEALGYEWHFVEYTEQKWQDLHEKGITDKFIYYAFNGVSIPHLQDFLAVYELKEKKILKENDVFVPGHTFDFLVGSNLEEPDMLCENNKMAVERTFRMHTKNTDWTASPVKSIEEICEKTKVDPHHFQEYFNWQEKRAKFLVNACRGYEFFGFKVRLPYWDKEIVDFWLMVPDKDRMGRTIFLEAENHGILVDKIVSIPFYGKVDRDPPGVFESVLRKLLPDFIKTLVLRFTRYKVKYNAGLNQIWALKSKNVKELLDPVEDFPIQVRPYFSDLLNRFPFQLEYHFLTSLYTLRKQFDSYN